MPRASAPSTKRVSMEQLEMDWNRLIQCFHGTFLSMTRIHQGGSDEPKSNENQNRTSNARMRKVQLVYICKCNNRDSNWEKSLIMGCGLGWRFSLHLER